MKELRPHIRKNLPPLKLYLEDIEFVVKRLESISAVIAIKTQTHEFENITEFCQITKDSLRALEVRSRDPYLALNLDKSSAFLYLSEDRPEARGVLEQIDSYLRKRRKTFTSILAIPFLGPALLPFGVIIPLSISRLVPADFKFLAFFIGIFLLLLFYLLAFFLCTQMYTIVIPKHKSDAPSFWERNWEKIVIGATTGILGFLLGWLAKFLPGPK